MRLPRARRSGWGVRARFWLGAQEPPDYEKPKIRMARITSPIKVDGDLSDTGWAEATVVPLAYEINPGDNTTRR